MDSRIPLGNWMRSSMHTHTKKNIKQACLFRGLSSVNGLNSGLDGGLFTLFSLWLDSFVNRPTF